MRVLILINSISGLFCFREKLIQTLAENNCDVCAVVPISSGNDAETEEKLRQIGCNVLHTALDRRGINPIRDAKLFFDYLKILRRQRPELVITYTVKPNIYGGWACRLMKIPYAANITGIGTAFQSDGLLKTLVTLMQRTALRKAKVVFFENSGNRQTFVDLKIVPIDKTHVLNGAGVDLEKFSIAPYPTDSGETRFLFIGRVMKEKGIDELLAAMRLLIKDGEKCSLDVVGGYEEDYSRQFTQAEEEGWLRYHGSQMDVRPFIAASHCFVLPSWHEGMANTNLECAASCRPVITSNIHGCLEAVEDGVSGFLCESKNAEDLYRTMKRFMALSDTERETMGLNGRKRMEEVFDKKKVVEETISLILS
ncbi:MAG: glycosyltransferase family 4 protein [Eubacteriales bacterium]|nr:glycosyltransferase family 4 protein [Eubacteriales bacterium]